MDRTLELRWFIDAATPDAAQDWFDTLGDASTKERNDMYLLTGSPACNVKWRSGKIQTKRRMRAPTRAHTPTGFRGWHECWHKWSFGTGDTPPERDDNLWIPVHKVRQQIERDLPNGIVVKIELTRVEACGEAGWSVCIEAETESPTQPLQDALGHAKYMWMEQVPDLPFSRDTSMGYSRWLHDVAGHPLPPVEPPTTDAIAG
jgi:hypothetical protein